MVNIYIWPRRLESIVSSEPVKRRLEEGGGECEGVEWKNGEGRIVESSLSLTNGRNEWARNDGTMDG